MAEKKKTPDGGAHAGVPLQLDAPVRITGAWMGHEYTATLKPIAEQEAAGDLERLFCDQATSGLATPGKAAFEAKVSYARRVITGIEGIAIDTTQDDWQQLIPYPVCVAIGRAIEQSYAMPEMTPDGLGDDEKKA